MESPIAGGDHLLLLAVWAFVKAKADESALALRRPHPGSQRDRVFPKVLTFFPAQFLKDGAGVIVTLGR